MGRVLRFVLFQSMYLLPFYSTSLIGTRRSETSSEIGAKKLKFTSVLVNFLRTASVARVISSHHY